MVKTLNTPSNSLHKRQGKDKHFEVQMKRVFAAFKRKPSTMLMVSIETGILRANICRYVAKWQKQGSPRYGMGRVQCNQRLFRPYCRLQK